MDKKAANPLVSQALSNEVTSWAHGDIIPENSYRNRLQLNNTTDLPSQHNFKNLNASSSIAEENPKATRTRRSRSKLGAETEQKDKMRYKSSDIFALK